MTIRKKPYQGTIRKRGKKFCCSYWIRNRQFTRSFDSLDQAETFLITETLRKKQGNFTLPNIRITTLLDMVISNMRTNKRRNTHTEKRRIESYLRPFFGRIRVRDFKAIDYELYIAERRENHASDSCINREGALLRKGFRLALKDGLIDREISIPMLKEKPAKKMPFTESEYATFRKHLPADARRIVDFNFEVGWRFYSEVCPLQWNQISFTNDCLVLPPYSTKDQKPRKMFFTERMRDLLTDQRKYIDSLQKKLRKIIPWVFVDAEGNPFFKVRMDTEGHCHNEPGAYFLWCWKRAQEGAKTTKTTHSMRSGAAVRRDNAGVSPKINQLMGGWATPAMLDRYLNMTDDDLKEAARKIDDFRRKPLQIRNKNER